MASTAAEIPSPIEHAASSMAVRAFEPIPPAAKVRSGSPIIHRLIDGLIVRPRVNELEPAIMGTCANAACEIASSIPRQGRPSPGIEITPFPHPGHLDPVHGFALSRATPTLRLNIRPSPVPFSEFQEPLLPSFFLINSLFLDPILSNSNARARQFSKSIGKLHQSLHLIE